jgi:3-deoxy-manno-octulosonate cytidylyltransferase (CMP-KDO synthetase)
MALSLKKKTCIIIPARYASTRFPGKPLVPLLGKPMILRVANICAQVVGQDHVYIATESNEIAECVRSAGFTALMTKSDALTGTDRVAEAAGRLDYEIYVNVQGDEPMVNPTDVTRCIRMKESNQFSIINGFTWVADDEDVHSVNLPKVVTNERGRLIYISRNVVPAFKVVGNKTLQYKKQVCIYAFSKDDLMAFQAFGRKSDLEKSEDIEILRFFELGREVLMCECAPGSLAVDVPGDVSKVEKALEKSSEFRLL